MPSNLLIQMRPPAPPVQETFAEGGDLFHPAVSSQNTNLRTLPTLTLERFADAKKNVEDHLGTGSVNIPKGAEVGVIPLGTGSAIPTKYRNGWSIYRFVGQALLDVGCYHCSFVNPSSDTELGKHSVGRWRRHLGAARPSVRTR